MQIDLTGQFKDNADQLDDYVYENSDSLGMFFGNYYIYNIDRDKGDYTVLCYVNAT
jgi:hypothetical protein